MQIPRAGIGTSILQRAKSLQCFVNGKRIDWKCSDTKLSDMEGLGCDLDLLKLAWHRSCGGNDFHNMSERTHDVELQVSLGLCPWSV